MEAAPGNRRRFVCRHPLDHWTKVQLHRGTRFVLYWGECLVGETDGSTCLLAPRWDVEPAPGG